MITNSKATLHFIFTDETQAVAAVTALKGEEAFKKRSCSNIIQSANEVTLVIESNDCVSLRASINAYLRDLQVCEAVEKDID